MSFVVTQLVGFGGVRRSSVATISYRTNTSDSVDRSVYTFPGLDIGTAGTNRHVVVGVVSSGTSPSISGITIGGASATAMIEQAETNLKIGLWIAQVSSGATGDVVVTHTGTMLRCGVIVWAVYDLLSATPTATASDSAPPLSQSLTISAGGVGIGLADGYQNGSTASWTWTGLTEDADTDFSEGANHDAMSGASLASSAGTTITVTASKTGSDSNDNFVLVALR